MGAITQDIIDDIRGRSDIIGIVESYVKMKRRGHDHWGCCPFHNEKTPSFKVSAQHQAYHCFGCHKSGDVFGFVMEKENVDFIGAVRLLAQRCGVVIPEERRQDRAGGEAASGPSPRERLFKMLAAAAQWYQQLLRTDAEAERARRYLKDRGVPDEAVARFGLGYSLDSWDACLQWGRRLEYTPELLLDAGLLVPREGGETARDGTYDRFRGRLMFPIWDELGRVVGFSARILEKDAKTAKYVNTPETPVFHKGKLLYALHLARPAFKELGFALVCEGQLDVIACHRAGMTNAIAPQGTAFTDTQATLLKRFSDDITFCFDADEAGEKAALRSLEIAIACDLKPKLVRLPAGEDPDSLFRKQGNEALAGLLRNGHDAIEFVCDLGCRDHDPQSAEGKGVIAGMVLPIVARFPSPITRASYCHWLAQRLGLPQTAVFDSLNQFMRQDRRTGQGAQAEAGTPAAPVIVRLPQSSTATAERMLLDLAIHDADTARHIAGRLAPDSVSDTPVGHALNRVLGLAIEDEWGQASAEIMKDEVLGKCGDVVSVLMSTDFAAPEAEEEDAVIERMQRLAKATDDCLAKLEKERLDAELKAVQEAMRAERDPARQGDLARHFQELKKRGAEGHRRAAVPRH